MFFFWNQKAWKHFAFVDICNTDSISADESLVDIDADAVLVTVVTDAVLFLSSEHLNPFAASGLGFHPSPQVASRL
jgi:hypothetical protein